MTPSIAAIANISRTEAAGGVGANVSFGLHFMFVPFAQNLDFSFDITLFSVLVQVKLKKKNPWFMIYPIMFGKK